jgi:methionyl-tRNA synthetase
LRLYLAKEIPYGGDGDFTWERFEEKYNADLANNLGNLVNRVASMTERYQQGRVMATDGGSLRATARHSVVQYREAMNVHALHEGAAAAFTLISAANNFIAEKEPWKLAKDPARATELNGVLADLAESVRIAATLLLPIMPTSAGEVLRRVGDERALSDRRLTESEWRSSGEKQVLNAGALWPRLEADKGVTVTEEQKPAAAGATVVTSAPGVTTAAPATQAGPAPAETPSTITIDDFMKIHLKVAKVLEAEKMPKSQKLLKLKVDAGEAEARTILAGIAESYEPEALIGKSIVIVANLAPRKMMGIESNGMVLAASPDGGAAIVLNSEPATPGTRVR